MRISRMMLPAAAAAMILSACSAGYNGGGVVATGSGLDVYAYSASTDGDWHAHYREWTPTTVYEANGSYYPNKVKGARQVQVYHTQTGYVMPPRDQDWAKTDTRFSSKKVPTDADYARARPRN